MRTRWPIAEDLRGLWDIDGTLLMQVMCPHADTSKHRQVTDRYNQGTEYCNLCGAARSYDLTYTQY